MSDNTSTKIESAKRNIEVAMDGIKEFRPLAEAFGDEISGVADWVARNHYPMDAVLPRRDQRRDRCWQGVLYTLPLRRWVDRATFRWPGEAAAHFNQDMRDAFGGLGWCQLGSSDDPHQDPGRARRTKGKINDWAVPLLKARVHDATVAMSWGHGRFLREGGRSGARSPSTVKPPAEQALAVLTKNIDGSGRHGHDQRRQGACRSGSRRGACVDPGGSRERHGRGEHRRRRVCDCQPDPRPLREGVRGRHVHPRWHDGRPARRRLDADRGRFRAVMRAGGCRAPTPATTTSCGR